MDECKYKCIYNKSGKCAESGGECIREDCTSWQDCDYCRKADRCEI